MLAIGGCKSSKRDEHEIYLGTIAGPETGLVEVAQKFAKEKYDLKIKIIEFEDYNMPNTALAEGSIDANMFQHQPYLDIVVENKHFAIETIGKTFVYPMGIYSKKYTDFSALPMGAKVAIPNDPSNGARALRLLAKAGLIQVDDKDDIRFTLRDITDNPKKLKFTELDAAQMPRVLADVDLAVINTNYAIPSGLKPKTDALFMESADSPYANIVVVRSADKNEAKYQQLMEALHSQPVLEEAKTLFLDQAIPAWK